MPKPPPQALIDLIYQPHEPIEVMLLDSDGTETRRTISERSFINLVVKMASVWRAVALERPKR